MTLAQRFSRLIDNRVHATEVPLVRLGVLRFRKGDWLVIGTAPWEQERLVRVWGYRNDADVILLY